MWFHNLHDINNKGNESFKWMIYSSMIIATSITFLTTFITFKNHLLHFHVPSLQRLCLRIVLVLPLFNMGMLNVFFHPEDEIIIEPILLFYEGYAIYCFYALLVLYSGGSHATSNIFNGFLKNEKIGIMRPCCCLPLCVSVSNNNQSSSSSLSSSTSSSCGIKNIFNILIAQMMFVRPLIMTMKNFAILMDKDIKMIKGLKLLSTSSLVLAMMSLLSVYRMLYYHIKGLNSESKFLGIKILVLVIVIQNAVIELLDTKGFFNIMMNDDNNNNNEEEEQHIAVKFYTFVTILEIAVFAIFINQTFSHDIFIKIGNKISSNNSSSYNNNNDKNNNDNDDDKNDGKNKLRKTFYEKIFIIFNFFSIMEQEDKSEINEYAPLVNDVDDNDK